MNNFAKDLDQMELPEIHSSDGKEYFLDPVRKKLILKTPEEVIRQKMIQYIMKILGVPDKLIQVESCFPNMVQTARRGQISLSKNSQG